MRTQQLICKMDTHVEQALAGLPQALAQHTLLCDTESPVPGLPCFDAIKAQSRYDRDQQEYVYDTPWGAAVLSYGYKLGMPSLYLIAPAVYCLLNGADAPLQAAPEIGHAVIDTLSGIVAVYRDSLPEQAVYDTRVASLSGRTGEEVLSQVWVDLALAGVPVCPLELYGGSTIPYPWKEVGGFAVTHAANGEVSVPLVGYVLDPNTDNVVYLHIAGNKTALRSIWGTLANGGAQSISIAGSGRHLHGYSSHNYTTFSDAVDLDANIYHMIIADRRVTEQEAEGCAYLVIPKATSAEDLDLDGVFAARLNALLPVPVLPEWGKTLRRYGIVDSGNLLTPCLYGGDVEKAYVITDDDGEDGTKSGWLGLIESLVQSGELSIQKEVN